MSAKHTPGPWEYSHDNGDEFRLIGAGGITVVGGCGCCGSPSMDGNPEADARLIAAAPELLDALEWLVALLPDPELDTDEVQRERVTKARAVITKATGRPA